MQAAIKLAFRWCKNLLFYFYYSAVKEYFHSIGVLDVYLCSSQCIWGGLLECDLN